MEKCIGVGGFNKAIDKMIDELVSMAEKDANLQEYMDEISEYLFEDDPHSSVIEYIAYFYDMK